MRSVISVLPLASMYFDERTSIGLVLTSFGAAMRDPVTMISCSAGSGAAAAAGACCAIAGISMAAMHTHADNTIANRFINHVTPGSLSILILVSPAMIHTCLRARTCELSLWTHNIQSTQTPPLCGGQ